MSSANDPLAGEDRSPAARPSPSILVVEDDWLLASNLTEALSELHYRVEGPVNTGENAIEASLRTRPDLVLMDIRLPGTMDGVAAATRINNETGIPVVFLTGHADAATLRRATNASPYSYLLKPFESDELRCAIEVSLHRHEIEVKLREREREVARLNATLEQRVAERTAQLEAANGELEAFSYSVAHDLRGPLRSIDGFTQLVLQEHAASLDNKSRDHLQRVLAATHRMARLIDDLLELAQVTRTECAQQPFDLSVSAAEIDAELRVAYPGRKVEFLNQAGVKVNGEPTLLRVILYNLLSNAWKFTAPVERARIEFRSELRGQELICSVRDNGVGFEMKHAQQLFGVFKRLDNARGFAGNGIGLALVQRAVQRHGGHVWAEAEPGRGAIFRFSITGQPQQASACH